MLTVEERLSLYLILEAEADTIYYNEKICDDHGFDSHVRTGLCKLMEYLTGISCLDLSAFTLPEILKHKPAGTTRYWWPKTEDGWVIRKEVLRNAIIECEQTIFNNQIESDVYDRATA